MLAEVVEKGVVHLGLPALYAERDALRQDIQQLQDEHARLQDAVAAARDELIRVQQQEEAARERTGSLGDSARKLEDAISAAQALEAFLLGLDPGDRIFVNVAKIAEIRQKHPGRLQALEQILAESVRKGIREFLARISTIPNLPPPTMPGGADAPTHG